MIRRLNKNAHVAEIHGCVDRIVRIWGEYPALAKRAILSDIMQSLATENSVFLASINREKVVSGVKEYDDKRDEAIKNLSLAIDGMTVLPDVDKESALVLKKIFAKFGKKITALNRTAESTKIASLLQEFSSAEAVKALEALPQIKTMISALEAAEVALLDISATWCQPCKILAPVIDQLSDEFAGKVEFFNADAEENPQLAKKLRVMSIPNLVIMKEGKVVARQAGFQGAEELRAWLEANI